MRITTATADHLVIDHVNWGNAAIGLAVVAVVAVPLLLGADLLQDAPAGVWLAVPVGFGLAAFGSERTQFRADRTAGRIILRRRTLFGATETSHPLDAVKEVRLNTEIGHRGRTDWRAEVCLHDGTVLPVAQFWGSEQVHRRAADAIRDWLSQSGPGPA